MEEMEQGPSTSQEAPDSEYDSNDYDNPSDEYSEDEDTFEQTKRGPRRLGSKLNLNLKGLMGEANLRYARGEIETAKKMCFEVMRQAPDAYEPYITLAQIFENTDTNLYEGYLSIATCLYPRDPAIWCRLAEINVQNGKLREAILCYTRAVRANPKNILMHKKRLEVVEQINDHRMALICKKHMANHMSRSQYQNIIELCKNVTTKYHEDKQYVKALEVLQIPFKRIPQKVTQDLINMMLELLILTGRLTECLDIFTQHCNFEFEITVDEAKLIKINSYKMPANIQIDLKVKFIVCLIKLQAFEFVSKLIDSMILQENVEDIGDLYLDVAEDLMSAHLPQEALKLLIPLVKSKSYNLAAVWLKYADCLYDCNHLELAVEAYFTVMKMAPQHVEVLYPLAMTLLKLNKKTEALQVLSQDLSANKVDVAVLVERMKLLKQIGHLDEYWKCAELLLSRHCIVVKYPEEAKVLLYAFTRNEKIQSIREKRMFHDDTSPIETHLKSIREPDKETEYQIYRGILKFALDKMEYAQFQRFAFMGLTSTRFSSYYKDIMVACFFASIYNHDDFHAYIIIRNSVIFDTDNTLKWNLLNIVLQTADEVRHHRFITRQHDKVPSNYCLQTIDANNNLKAGNLNIAMKFYMKEFRKHRSPYFAFILGVILLQGYTKRNDFEHRNKLTEIITYLFLYYAKNRSSSAQHEVYYNLGRLYHQLGVMHLAERYYLKVLELDNNKYNDEIFGLNREAAYNLHLIYRNSGNSVAARNILIKHLVI